LKEIDEIRRVIESRRQMQMSDSRRVQESDIPLDVLYNLKIERIRATEDKQNAKPEPIRFQILESGTNKPNQRKVKFECESIPEPEELEID
jgi:hypothetical protein